jgi:hypothetical protein
MNDLKEKIPGVVKQAINTYADQDHVPQREITMTGMGSKADEDENPEMSNIDLDNAAYYGRVKQTHGIGFRQERFPWTFGALMATPEPTCRFCGNPLEGELAPNQQAHDKCRAGLLRQTWRNNKKAFRARQRG